MRTDNQTDTEWDKPILNLRKSRRIRNLIEEKLIKATKIREKMERKKYSEKIDELKFFWDKLEYYKVKSKHSPLIKKIDKEIRKTEKSFIKESSKYDRLSYKAHKLELAALKYQVALIF